MIETTYGKWLALGDGWAVMGATAEEAQSEFAAAEERHSRIAARPPAYTQAQPGAATLQQ
jgi:hypothetical protein